MEETYGVVYKAVNEVNGMEYIGQTTMFHKRVKQHLYYSAYSPLKDDVRKYGDSAFSFIILEKCDSREEMIEKEMEHIQKEIDKGKQLRVDLYNKTMGGQGNNNWKPTYKSRQKMSQSHTGKVMTASHRKAIGDGHRGLKRTEEQKERMKMAKVGSYRFYFDCGTIVDYKDTSIGQLCKVYSMSKQTFIQLYGERPVHKKTGIIKIEKIGGNND